nr:hypothetical protein [Tanacetum cinerariifolium]
MMEADSLLAERLQAREREEFSETRKDYGTKSGSHSRSASSSFAFDHPSSSHHIDDDNEGTSRVCTPFPTRYVNSLSNDVPQKFRIQQYLQNENYALWEVIEFGNSYKAPPEESSKGPASESFAKKKGRTVFITIEDMQKRRNDVKARTTLLLALPDEHQLRFSKYETAKEL